MQIICYLLHGAFYVSPLASTSSFSYFKYISLLMISPNLMKSKLVHPTTYLLSISIWTFNRLKFNVSTTHPLKVSSICGLSQLKTTSFFPCADVKALVILDASLSLTSCPSSIQKSSSIWLDRARIKTSLTTSIAAIMVPALVSFTVHFCRGARVTLGKIWVKSCQSSAKNPAVAPYFTESTSQCS